MNLPQRQVNRLVHASLAVTGRDELPNSKTESTRTHKNCPITVHPFNEIGRASIRGDGHYLPTYLYTKSLYNYIGINNVCPSSAHGF